MASTATSTPRSRGTLGGRRPWSSSAPERATSVADGRRPTKEKRLQRSPRSTDSSRKPGPLPTRRRKAATGVMRSDRTSHHTGTMAWWAASSWNSALLGFRPLLLVVGEARLMALVAGGGCAGPVTAEAPGEAGDVPGVAGAPCPPGGGEQEHVAVAGGERPTAPP